MMKPEIKAQWLTALRSGEYKQGTGALRNGNAFCCLGVLCDLAAKQGVGKWEVTGVFTVESERAGLLTPVAVAVWAELPHYNPRVGRIYDDDWRFGVADYNDGVEGTDMDIGPHTFAQIADLIEADL